MHVACTESARTLHTHKAPSEKIRPFEGWYCVKGMNKGETVQSGGGAYGKPYFIDERTRCPIAVVEEVDLERTCTQRTCSYLTNETCEVL